METRSRSAISQYANGLESSATQIAAFSYENLRLRLRLDFEGNLNIRRLKTSLLWQGHFPDNYDNGKCHWKTFGSIVVLSISCLESPFVTVLKV